MWSFATVAILAVSCALLSGAIYALLKLHTRAVARRQFDWESNREEAIRVEAARFGLDVARPSQAPRVSSK